MQRLPDFIMVGATKCGTSSIYNYLKQHPQIFMPAIKEINYFLNGPEGPHRRSKAHDLGAYAAYFQDCPPDRICGEVAPSYLGNSLSAPNIKQAVPGAHIFIMLRDPVRRSFSAFIMAARNGQVTRDPEAAFSDRNAFFIRASLYYERIKRFYDLFSSDQLSVLLYDDLVADNVAFMQSLYGLLGVDEAFVPDVRARSNPGYLPRLRFLHKILSNQIVRQKIIPHLPAGVYRLGVKFRKLNAVDTPVLTASLELALRDYFRSDLEKTQELTGLDLAHWM